MAVEPVVHAVVADEGLFRLGDCLHYKAEAHFFDVDVFFALFRFGLFLLLLFALLRLPANWRPAQLLSTEHVQAQVWLLLLPVFTFV